MHDEGIMDNHQLADRVSRLESRMASVDTKLDRLLLIFERGSGAWWLIRWLGAFIVGCAAIWAVVGDHIHWR